MGEANDESNAILGHDGMWRQSQEFYNLMFFSNKGKGYE
jgi:hypothetical protein